MFVLNETIVFIIQKDEEQAMKMKVHIALKKQPILNLAFEEWFKKRAPNLPHTVCGILYHAVLYSLYAGYWKQPRIWSFVALKREKWITKSPRDIGGRMSKLFEFIWELSLDWQAVLYRFKIYKTAGESLQWTLWSLWWQEIDSKLLKITLYK